LISDAAAPKLIKRDNVIGKSLIEDKFVVFNETYFSIDLDKSFAQRSNKNSQGSRIQF
jgi:hypothetical protein